jgi:hypothetical protein
MVLLPPIGEDHSRRDQVYKCNDFGVMQYHYGVWSGSCDVIE